MSQFTYHNNAPVWIQIPAYDVNRAAKFYENVLNFTIHWGTVPGEMKTAHFSFPGTPFEHILSGGIKARGTGYPQKLEDAPDAAPATMYFYVEDLEAAMAKIVAHGGKQVSHDRIPEGDHGSYMDFRDTEGNFYGIHTTNAKK